MPTISSQITVSSDDVRYRTTDGANYFLDLTPNKNPVGDATAWPNGPLLAHGLRFLNVQVPAGSIINNADILYVATPDPAGWGLNQTGTVNVLYEGELNPVPATFSTVSDYQSRQRTSNGMQWLNIAPWTDGDQQVTPNLAAILQEIINQPSWVSGNPLVLFASNIAGSTSARFASAFDQDPVLAPILTVTYTTSTIAAAISPDVAQGNIPLPVTFTANVSGGSPPYNWIIDFGDGTNPAAGTQNTPDAFTIPHTYDTAGTFSVLLSVTDAETSTVYASTSVVTTEPPTDGNGEPPQDNTILLIAGAFFAVVVGAALLYKK